jgi:hypothetical protein
LDAAEQAINLYAGPVGDVTETLTAGSGDLVMLSRPASAITSVSERLVTLASNDYQLDGRALRRLAQRGEPAELAGAAGSSSRTPRKTTRISARPSRRTC